MSVWILDLKMRHDWSLGMFVVQIIYALEKIIIGEWISAAYSTKQKIGIFLPCSWQGPILLCCCVFVCTPSIISIQIQISIRVKLASRVVCKHIDFLLLSLFSMATLKNETRIKWLLYRVDHKVWIIMDQLDNWTI